MIHDEFEQAHDPAEHFGKLDLGNVFEKELPTVRGTALAKDFGLALIDEREDFLAHARAVEHDDEHDAVAAQLHDDHFDVCVKELGILVLSGCVGTLPEEVPEPGIENGIESIAAHVPRPVGAECPLQTRGKEGGIALEAGAKIIKFINRAHTFICFKGSMANLTSSRVSSRHFWSTGPKFPSSIPSWWRSGGLYAGPACPAFLRKILNSSFSVTFGGRPAEASHRTRDLSASSLSWD